MIIQTTLGVLYSTLPGVLDIRPSRYRMGQDSYWDAEPINVTLLEWATAHPSMLDVACTIHGWRESDHIEADVVLVSGSMHLLRMTHPEWDQVARAASESAAPAVRHRTSRIATPARTTSSPRRRG